MNKEQFDQWFDSAFEESVRESSQHSIPEADASWQRIRQQLNLQRTRKLRRRRWQMTLTIAASLCIGAFIFGSPQLTKAIEPIKAMFAQFSDEMVGIFYGEREQREDPLAPPPGAEQPSSSWGTTQPFAPIPLPESESILTRSATLEEAIQLSEFPVYTPKHVKEDYELTGVDLTIGQQGEVILVNFTYEREDQKDVYLVNQSLLHPDSLMNFYKDGDEAVSDITIGQTHGKLFEGKRNMLVLFHQDTLIMIRGELTVEEIQQIAVSMIQPME